MLGRWAAGVGVDKLVDVVLDVHITVHPGHCEGKWMPAMQHDSLL